MKAKSNMTSLSEELKTAIETKEIERFYAMLNNNLKRGDINHPSSCRNKSDVIKMINAILSTNLTIKLGEIFEVNDNLVCELSISHCETNNIKSRLSATERHTLISRF